VVRETDASDGRGIRLFLTSRGGSLYRKLIHAAAERNDAFVGCLTAKERAMLDAVMAKLANEARSFIQQEKTAR
jgi:DNA-binding MarR family transcriptional regulator